MTEATAEESIPPDKATPSGTSLLRWSFTLSKNKVLSFRAASSKLKFWLVVIFGFHQQTGLDLETFLRSKVMKCAGNKWFISWKKVSLLLS